MRTITQDELQRRLGSERNIANGVEFCMKTSQTNHKFNLPEPIRDVITSLANVPGVKGTDVAREFGVSQQCVSASKLGKVGGAPATEERKEKVQSALDGIKDIALKKLMSTLNLIDDDKLEDCSAKELSKIATDMARVHQSLSPAANNLQQVQLVVYSPQINSADSYKVVEVDAP